MLIENFGGFLDKAKEFIAGNNSGNFIGADKGKGSDVPADLYTAENLRNLVITTANKVDNIIGMANEKDRAEAKASAGEIISFLRSSFVKLEEIIKEGGKGNMTDKARTSALSDISSQLGIINRNGGVIDKWKTEFLGKSGSKVAGSAYFDKGKALIEKAKSIMKVVGDTKAIKDKLKSTEFDQIIKRSSDAISGGDQREFKPKEDVFTSKENNDPEVVKRYRDRLKMIGVEAKGEGKYTDSDKPSTKQAMQYIGTVTGKTYGDSDDALADFQKDLGAYVSKQDDVKKLLM
jgi:hypothetical protein